MKYVVNVNGEAIALDLSSDGVRLIDATGAPGELRHAELIETVDSAVALLRVDTAVFPVVIRRDGATPGACTVVLGGERFQVEAVDERSQAVRAMARAAAPTHRALVLRAPMPGLVVGIAVNVGDRVEAGDRVVVMEAMKMENELHAPAAGVVRSIAVSPGTAVEKGALLVEFE
jgi:biotin carboxyl carrier protein